jgi:DNA replication protein DnaC
VDAFDFSNVAFPDGWGLAEMRTLRFVDAAEDLVFFGKTGRGKTHVAIGLGMLAVSAGLPVRYYQVADLVTRLRRAASEGTLDKVYSEVTKASMVILDEFGFVPCGVEGARLLFQVISLCYEQRSIVFTTNIEFSKWGTVLADDKLAAAIVDRVVHHGRLVTFGGPSYRLANSLMMGTGTAAAGAAAAGGDRS